MEDERRYNLIKKYYGWEKSSWNKRVWIIPIWKQWLAKAVQGAKGIFVWKTQG